MIIVGGDGLALGTASEICQLKGHRVIVLWHADAHLAGAVEAVGAEFVAGRPDSQEALENAGIDAAITILALSPDDRLNLTAALRARDANPGIRIVLRQFNRTLAHKVEQNLPDCAVLSLAWHSAATFAACAVDPNCFRGLQFPEPDGPLTGFALRSAESRELGGKTVVEAEHLLEARLVAIDGRTDFDRDQPIPRRAELVVFGEITRLSGSTPRRAGQRRRESIVRWWRKLRVSGVRAPRVDPIFGRLACFALAMFAFGTWYFHRSFGGDWLVAAFFVLTTMTTNGYTDLTPDKGNSHDIILAMLLMLAGVTFSGIFIAFGTSALTRAQWVRVQGLRPVRRRGHIVICGAGSIGSNVIDLLLPFDKPLVVVERRPDEELVERAREVGFDLLTGDASRDAALDLCNLEAAHTLLALTNSDTLNLEIALGARARNPEMPIVLRIAEANFAASIARHFEFETTFSAEALAAPAFASLSRLGRARGRVTFGGKEYAMDEKVVAAEEGAESAHPNAVPIALARDGRVASPDAIEKPRPGDRMLFIVPLAPFKEGKDTLAAAAERVASADEAMSGR